MPVGLEVFDENGVKILGMDKSVIRIIKVLDKVEFYHWHSANSNKRYIKFFSCYIDFDVYGNEYIDTNTHEPFKWIHSYIDKVLIGVINVSN